jgi:hypothetical protein
MTYDEVNKVTYSGEWREGKRNGYGVMIYKSGNSYEGL